MPILATRNEQDLQRLREFATTQFERDLVETVIALKGKYVQIFDTFRYALKLVDDENLSMTPLSSPRSGSAEQV